MCARVSVCVYMCLCGTQLVLRMVTWSVQVTVEEPTVEQSVRILRRLRTRLEKQFGK